MNDQDNLLADILKADLDAYRKLETWGSSLFLGAIGLVGKQFIEWEKFPAEGKELLLSEITFLFPALIGLAAFIFLRIVNFRSHKTSMDLRKVAGVKLEDIPKSKGLLGFALATMPLLLGYAISWYLSYGCSTRSMSMWIFIGVVVFLSAILIRFLTDKKIRSKYTPQDVA